MQGDIHRAKQKEKERLREKPEISRILSGVDDIKLNDSLEKEDHYSYENRIVYNPEETEVRHSKLTKHLIINCFHNFFFKIVSTVAIVTKFYVFRPFYCNQNRRVFTHVTVQVKACV